VAYRCVVPDQPHVDEFVTAGLIDPDDPRAGDRRRVLAWLAAQGFTIEEMRAAEAGGRLSALVGDTLGRHVTLSIRDVSERTGITIDHLLEWRRAAGLQPVDVTTPVYLLEELEVFEQLKAAAELFSWNELMQFVRVVGSSMARIGDAANMLFMHDVERPMRESGASQFDLVNRSMQAVEAANGVSNLLRMMLRSHLAQAVAWSRQARANLPRAVLTVPMSVGFVDLVGFTRRAGTIEAADLAELVSRFEARAHDVITDLGGRLVKLIGDEVMFVAVEAATGCDIAMGLLETFGDDPALTPRGGLAHGEVLARSGDFFGPTVNLAARLAEQAVPGEVLATPHVTEAAGRRLGSAGRRMLKGFSEPVEVVSLTV
jgi:adenylate cyclase